MRASSLRRNTRLTSSAISGALGGCGRSSRANTSRSCGTVSAGIFFSQPLLLPHQEPQGQQRQRHVVVPAHPAAHLVLPPPPPPLARLQRLLDPVPPPVHLRPPLQRHPRRRIGQGVPGPRLPL